MPKDRSNFTPEGLGFSGLSSNPVVQQADSKRAAEQADTLFPVEFTDKVGTFSGNAPISDYQDALDKGANLTGTPDQIEHTLGEYQGTGTQLAIGARKFLRGIPINLAEMAGNIAAGAKALTGDNSWLSPDNSWNKYFEDINTELNNAAPIHSTDSYDNGSVLDKVMTSKFWTDDIASGGAFLMAQILGTKGLGATVGIGAKGVGALSKATNLGELFNSIPITQRIAAATANKFTVGTIGFINAASISAMQAKGTANQIEAKLRSNYSSQINPGTGDYYTPQEIDSKIAMDQSVIEDRTNSTFWATMATELLPSIYASKLFLGPGKTALSEMNADIVQKVNAGKVTLADIEKGVGYDAMKKAGWSEVKKQAAHAAFIGGPVAMNAQLAIQKYDVDQGVAGHGGDVWDNSMGYARQFLDNFTQDEGLKGIVLGSVLGALAATFHGPQGANAYNESLKGHLDSMRASDALYGKGVDGPYKTDEAGKLILDRDANPVPDPDKLVKLTFQMLHDKNNMDNQTAAILAGNEDMVTLNEHVAMSQLIARELQSNRYDTTDNAREFFKWFHKQRMIEQSKSEPKKAVDQEVIDSAKNDSKDPADGDAAAIQTATALKTGSAQDDANLSIQVNKNSAMIDSIFNSWKSTEKQSARLNKLGDSPNRTSFNDTVRRTLYYEEVKRQALTEMIRDREGRMSEPGADRERLNEETNSLGMLKQDSENRSADLIKKPDEFYKEWNKLNGTREDLLNGVKESIAALDANKDDTKREGLSRKANTAGYMLREHVAKEGIAGQGTVGAVTGPDGKVVVPGDDGMGTNQFSINQPLPVRSATPIGLKNDTLFKAGSEYAKVGRLRDMMDKVPTGEISIRDVVGYARDNITHLDKDTAKKLAGLVADEKAKLTKDQQYLATLPEMDEDFNYNPEFVDLHKSIEARKPAIEQSEEILRKKQAASDFEQLSRTPEQFDEHLNKKFAEQSFVRADNIVANALEEDGKVKDTYTDARAVNEAIQQVTSMRDAIQDRTTDGDLKGQKGYNYLIEKANKMLAELARIRDAVEDNKIRRDGIQKALNQREAASNAIVLGFNLDTNSITNPAIFSAADLALNGKLSDLMKQIREVPSGNHYEASMAVLHAIKTIGTTEQLTALRETMSEHADGLVAQLPTLNVNKFLAKDFVKSPGIYFEEMFRAMYREAPYDESKNGPLSQFRRNNDIDELESRITALPESTDRNNVLQLVRTYKEISGIHRVQNLLNSNVDLSKTVASEIDRANAGNGIVPTTQQEIAIRDGLAWIGSNKQVGKAPFSGWGFLRGIAGTGKTNVTVKELLDLSDIKPEEIITTAATKAASDVIGRAVGAESIVTEELLTKEIPSGTKLIVIDEYARLPVDTLNEFEEKIRNHNLALDPKDRVKVLILGDPTQITPLDFANEDITNPVANSRARNIQVINPLTVVYRSEVSAVNETSDIFQNNPEFVKSINVRANQDINAPLAIGTHTGSSAQDIIDIVKRNQEYEKNNGLTPRTRVIITDQPSKYDGLGVQVLNVYDAQSETFDESYVDLSRDTFRGSEKYNTALYTAASRAKQYSYVRYEEGTNTVDPGLGREKENNDKVSRDAKGEYIKARTEEKGMMDAAATGKNINIPPTEAAVKVAAELPPLAKAIEPDTSEDAEIVTEIPSSDPKEPLPTDVDPTGDIDPTDESEVPPQLPLDSASLLDGEHILPNIEKGTFESLNKFDENGNAKQPDVVPGSDVHFMYTKEKNGENAITAFTINKDDNWIPVSKIFQKEIDKYPQYAQWKQKIVGMKPMFTSDPLRLNGTGSRAAYSVDSMAQHSVDTGKVTRTQRMTYQFGNEPVQGTGLAVHIKDIFRKRFYSPRESEQAKVDTLHYKIFKNNDIQGGKFAGFTPEAGIPYAIIGVPAGSNNYQGAQFIRLTANKLSQESDHYKSLKAYRDTAKRIEMETGVTPGTTVFNQVVRAMKKGLKLEHDITPTGVEEKPTVKLREDFTRAEFISELEKIHGAERSDTEFVDPTAHLSDEEFERILPNMQGLSSMIYGVSLVDTKLTPSEVARAHGEDYEHVPLKNPQMREVVNEAGETVQEPLGRVRLKGTGDHSGKPEVKVRHYELSAGKGEAQQALNQIAKANEFVGNVRIRVDANKAVGVKNARGPRPDGKSLMADQGGDTATFQSRVHLGKMLGEVRIAEGKLDPADLNDKEVRIGLEKEIRTMAVESDKSIMELGAKIIANSPIPTERKVQLLGQLDRVANQKETPPITMSTLDMLVGDENYINGEHTTADAYTIKSGKSGRTKETQTYLRTPLDIDQFNELGKSPESNAESLGRMVGTKFQDILPTQVAVSRDGIVRTAEPEAIPVEVPEVESTTPGSKQHIQNQLDEVTKKISESKSIIEKARLRKEQSRLESERDASSRMFDDTMRRSDKGEKITIESAKAEIRKLLPAISDSEMEFLNRSLMIELQRPGESLLGLFQKGKLYFAEQDGTVFSNVVRHEVFHKVFNDYLSPRDRNSISKEFDPESKMNPKELEEELADRFMTWQTRPETVTGKIKRIFNRILSWVGLARQSGGVEQLFNDINNGKFQKPNGSYPDVRMSFSDIRKYGTVSDYKKAAKYVQGIIKDGFIDDHIDNIPVTQRELFDNVRRELESRQNYYDQKIDGMLDEHKQLGEAFYATEDPSEKIELQEYIDATESQINEDNGYLSMLHTLNDGENLKTMWTDLYPNFKFEKEGIVSFDENELKEDPEATEKDEADINTKDSSNIAADFVQQSDERNQEGKISQNVKNFLSFIYRPDKFSREEGRIIGDRINPRGVYLQCLRNLSNLQSSDVDFVDQLAKRAAENGINLEKNSDGAIIVKKLIDLYHNATGEEYVFSGDAKNGKAQPINVELSRDRRFLDDNTFVIAIDGKDISGITKPADNDVVITRNGKSTSQFLNELVGAGLTMNEAKGYFRQHQAQETLRELMSNFLSQRESTPMIAEEVRGFTTTLKYFRAQNYGIERIKNTELENSFKEGFLGKVTVADWKVFNEAGPNNKASAIAHILKAMGVRGTDSMKGMDNETVRTAYGDLKAFRELVNEYKKAPKVNEEASDSDEVVVEINPVAAVLENNTGMLDRMTKLLTLNSSESRASSYTDTTGTKRYLFHNGSQAHDTLGKIVRKFRQKIGSLPEHLTEDTVLKKNIFANGQNTIYEILDHDGQRQEGKEEFATGYSGESNAQWLKRNFSDAFLTFAKTNARDNADPLTYMQNFYTISNRPRMVGARVEIMSEARIKEALHRAIEQHVEQPDLKSVKNYDRFKAVNFDEFHKALEEHLGERKVKDLMKNTEGRIELAKLYDRVRTDEEFKKTIADHITEQLKTHAEVAMQRMKAENVTLGSDVYEAMKLLKDKRRRILGDEDPTVEASINQREQGWPEDDQMRSTVQSFYMNNYVNGYFLNQSVAGNMNFFKDGLDMVKRMSGVFAPGTKGMVGNKFFMAKKFNVAISSDPKMAADLLSPIFKDTKLAEAVGRKAFDLADAQGFMTPERAENIVQGFGRAYNAGAVFKPAHYEIAKRTVDGVETYVPVMLKYSSVVLSDDLVSRFPKLEALRTEMRNTGTHEFIFDSGTKLGAPTEQVKLPGATDYENNNIKIKPDSIVELSGENYRLQLNPAHDAYTKTSNPTQLGYFLNVLHKLSDPKAPNLQAADNVYGAIAEKISRGISKLSETATDTGGKFKVSELKKMLTGAGNERIVEMLSSDINYNMPNIVDKAMIQMANLVSRDTVKIQFPGGKMVLQSSYGIDVPTHVAEAEQRFWTDYGLDQSKDQNRERRLQYIQDPKSGRWHAEVLLPMIYRDKANPGDFLLPDGMGFRIPSTELHSSLPLKIAGFYDDKGSNVVVGPAELVAQHGSDFDVDSLYVITREQAGKDISTPNFELKKGTPVGYYPVNGKLVFNGVRFRNELEQAKLDAAGDKRTLKQLEKLHDQFLNNQITESFLDTISHSSNKKRMLTPISTEVIDKSFKELGIDTENAVNLSRLLDNLQVFNSNFQGASLVGIFANGMKALSYMSRAGIREGSEDAYPQLNEKLSVTFNGQSYSKFGEIDHTGGNMWEELDALVNTSVDNVKEQKLYLMNATDRTGPAYVAAKAIGMPLTEAMRMMLQPIVKTFTSVEGGRGTVLPATKAKLLEVAREAGIIVEGQKYDDLREAVQDISVPTEKELKAAMKRGTLGTTKEEIAHQFHVLEEFEKINTMGEDLTTFSRAISVLQDMPVFYKDIASKVEQWDKLGTVTDGILTTNPDFSFSIDNLMQSQPNIKAAYEAFNWLKSSVDKSIIKHFPETTALAKHLADTMAIKMVYDKAGNVEAIKNEVVSYLVSSYYAPDLATQESVSVTGKKGRPVILTGRAAWSQQFSERAEKAIKENVSAEKVNNEFLRRIGVQESKYGIKSIQFANASNPDATEALEMQEGFNALEDSQLKADFVKYAVLNYGLSFGTKNYSMFIPSELLKPVSDYISKDIKSLVQSSSVDNEGNLVSGPLKNLSENLSIRMAVNNIKKLPFISTKKIEAVQAKDEKGKLRFTEDGIKIMSGQNADYYWHRAYENPKEGDKYRYKEEDLPAYMWRNESDRPAAYKRLNDVNSDMVYYQRIGYQNYGGGYDATLKSIHGGYDSSDYFGKAIPVPVPDVMGKVGKYETRNEYVKEGAEVIVYPYSNDTREQGIKGIVDKVMRPLGNGDQFSFTIRQPELPEGKTEQIRTMDIAHSMTSKFGLGLETDVTMNAKGRYENGTVYLNPKLMTNDTAFHEVSHPLVSAIKKQNPKWYSNLVSELKESKDGKAILSKVKAKYPELDSNGHEVEALVTAIGQEAAGRLETSNFRTLVRRLMRSVGNMVRSVINEIKVKGGISIETLGAEDMAKLSIGDIADILAAKDVKLGLDLSKVKDEPQYSKDLGDTLPEKDSVMSRILTRAETIQDPIRDENGQEGDAYKFEGKDLTRVSKVMDKFTFRDKKETIGPDGKPMSTIDAIAKREADRIFKNVAPGSKLVIDGIEQTRQEFEDSKRKIQLQARVKGDIIHAKIQWAVAHRNGNVETVNELDKKIAELSSIVDKLPSAYDWVAEKGTFSKLMANAGINIGTKNVNTEDKLFSEVKVASPLLGAGKVDQLIERPDGRLRIVDWKTGSRLKDKYSANVLRYGVQEGRITDNPLDRAKLQVMTYALIIKAEHPEAKFDGLVVMHLPNEFEATQGRNALAVEIPDYLRMMEQYYRHEESEVYHELLKKSPKIFDPREYNAPRNADFVQDVLNSDGASESEILAKARLDLQKLVVQVEMERGGTVDPWTKERQDIRQRLIKKIAQANSYINTDFTGALDASNEISIMRSWLGNVDDNYNPYVQTFSTELNNNKIAAQTELDQKTRRFRELLAPVIQETTGKRNLVQKSLTLVDKAKAFQGLWDETETIAEDGTKYLSRGLVTPKSENWANLSPAKKALATYMAKEMKDIFEEVMVKGKGAVVSVNDKNEPLTKLDLYNTSRKGASFKYHDGFMPRYPITAEEVTQRALKQGILEGGANYAKDRFLRYFTDFFENNIEGQNQKDYGMPVRFLGNGNTYTSPDTYTTDMQLAFEKYMHQMINKKHLDSTWAYGQAVKGLLEVQKDANGTPLFTNAVGQLGDHIENVLIGKTLHRGAKGLTRHGLTLGATEGKQFTISIPKLYRSSKSGVAAATLWAQPVRAAKNALQATWMIGKEAAINEIGQRYAGIRHEERDSTYSYNEHVKSYGEAMQSQWDLAAGKGRSNFVHTLARTLNLYPDIELGKGAGDSLTQGASLLNTKHLGFLYQIPEEVTTMQHTLNFLKTMKVQTGSEKGKSMYDIYKAAFRTNDRGEGYFELPKSFKRGVIEKADGTFEDLSGLHPLEVRKLQRTIQKLKGGYKADEKTRIQGNILGDAFMMFKRWIPAMAMQQYSSKFTDYSIGQFEPQKVGDELVQRNGEAVYDWRARVVEGRWRTLANWAKQLTPLSSQDGYAWADLSGEQRKGLIDAAISSATWMSMLAVTMGLLKDRDEKDSLKAFTADMASRYFEQWNGISLLAAAAQPPAVVKTAQEVMKGMWALITAEATYAGSGKESDLRTNKGDIKGVNLLMKHTPVVSAYYETKKFYDASGNDSIWDSISGY